MPPVAPPLNLLSIALLVALPLTTSQQHLKAATDLQPPTMLEEGSTAPIPSAATAHFSALGSSSAWDLDRADLWRNQPSASGSPSSTPGAFRLSPTVGSHSISVQGNGAVTQDGAAGWQLGMSASEDSNHRTQPEAAQSASLDAFTLERSYTDRGFVRLGRYQAQQLTAVGRLDGLQGELRLRDNLSGGVMAGFRSHTSSDIESTEPVAVAYLRTQLEDSDRTLYSGTFGFLGSAYDGEMDRAALLIEQQTTLAGKLALDATTEIDLDAFSELEEHVAPLTRLRLSGTLPVTSALTLRAGLRRDRRPDTRAERALYGGTDEEYTEGTWTHWTGASTQLPLGFKLGGEISVRDGIADENNGTDGKVSVSRRGLPLLPQAATHASVYTQGVGEARATAARLTTDVSWFEGRVSLQPSVTVSMDAPEDSSLREDALAVRAQWSPTPSWRVASGMSYRADGIDKDEALVEVGYQHTW